MNWVFAMVGLMLLVFPLNLFSQTSGSITLVGSVQFQTSVENGTPITAFMVKSSSNDSAFIKIATRKMSNAGTPAQLFSTRLAGLDRASLTFVSLSNADDARKYLPNVTVCVLSPYGRMGNQASYQLKCFEPGQNSAPTTEFVVGLDATTGSPFDQWLRATLAKDPPGLYLALQ